MNTNTLPVELEVYKNRYTFFSKSKHKDKNFYGQFYPDHLPEYPDLEIEDIEVGEIIKSRMYVLITEIPVKQIEGGLIDSEVINIKGSEIIAKVKTLLPDSFPISKGDIIKLKIDEVLCFVDGY